MPDVDPRKASLEPTVACVVCEKDIPKSEVYSPEGKDYALSFCGLACYAVWRRKAEESEGADRDDASN